MISRLPISQSTSWANPAPFYFLHSYPIALSAPHTRHQLLRHNPPLLQNIFIKVPTMFQNEVADFLVLIGWMILLFLFVIEDFPRDMFSMLDNAGDFFMIADYVDECTWLADCDEIVDWDIGLVMFVEPVLEFQLLGFNLCDWMFVAGNFSAIVGGELVEVGIKGDGCTEVFYLDDVNGMWRNNQVIDLEGLTVGCQASVLDDGELGSENIEVMINGEFALMASGSEFYLLLDCLILRRVWWHSSL